MSTSYVLVDADGEPIPPRRLESYTEYPVEIVSVMFMPNNDPEDSSGDETVVTLRVKPD